jgi:hypothetical protein
MPEMPDHLPAAHLQYEIDGALLEHPDAAALLRRASLRQGGTGRRG